jgi:hypothetical protein
VNLRRVVFWAVVVLMIVYVVRAPEHAAQVLRDAGSGVAVVAGSLVSFLGSLV